MEEATLKKYLDNIDDYLFIDNKIITCIWLSQHLKVHVNTAKQLLHEFLKIDGNKEKVTATYLLGGELKDGSGHQLRLVSGRELNDVKLLFSKLTTNHVYSIQKAVAELNSVSLYNAYPHFYVAPDYRKFCGLKPSKPIEKREVKLPVIETKKNVPPPPPKAAKPVENNIPPKPSNENIENDSKNSKVPEKTVKQTTKGKTGGAIGLMFSRQTEKNKNEPANKNKISNGTTEDKTDKKKAGGIGGFFSPQAAKKDAPSEEKMEVDSDMPIKETGFKLDEKQKENTENKQKTEDENKKSSGKEKKSKGKENRKKRKKRDKDKDDGPKKKRKRIMSLLSSESESSDNGEESECEMEPEPPPAPAPTVEEDEDIIPPTPGRKRIRKQIDKTYTDEDGFILTKKEYVYESCTDDECDEAKPAAKETSETKQNNSAKENGAMSESKPDSKPKTDSKNEDKKSSKKKSPPGKNTSGNKQASIMNFFKRK